MQRARFKPVVMPVERIENLPAGTGLFLDTNIFVYAFLGHSKQCRELLRHATMILTTSLSLQAHGYLKITHASCNTQLSCTILKRVVLYVGCCACEVTGW